MTNKVEGIIKGINGQIAEVEIITEDLPVMLEILHCLDEKDARLEVYMQSRTTVSCLILSNPIKLSRGMKVFGTGKDLQIAVGKQLLGKAVNLFGDALMETETILPESTMSIYAKTVSINVLESKFQILE